MLPLYEVDNHVAIITLNNPDKLNVVNSAVAESVGNHLSSAENDANVRVIVLTAAGSKFCAGGDLKALGRGENILPESNPEWGFGGITQRYISKPLIGAINGPAYGGGVEMALCCDLLVVADTASFTMSEVARGLVAGAGGAIRLPEQLSQRQALQMLLAAETIDAQTLHSWGLVNDVVPADQLISQTMQLANTIASRSPNAVKLTKRAVYQSAARSSHHSDDQVELDPWQINADMLVGAFTHPDFLEGPKAFAEKREPKWQD